MREALFEGSIKLVGRLLRVLSMNGSDGQYREDGRRWKRLKGLKVS